MSTPVNGATAERANRSTLPDHFQCMFAHRAHLVTRGNKAHRRDIITARISNLTSIINHIQADQVVRADVEADVIIAIVEGVFLRLHAELRHGHDWPPEQIEKRLGQAERCVWEAIRP